MTDGDSWETPDELFLPLNSEFDFLFDAACTTSNAKCAAGNFIDLGIDALEAPWHKAVGSIWLNPPYSRSNILPFMKKAYTESLLTTEYIVCLVRDDPTTRWYKNWVDGKALEVRRLKKRVRFVGATASYTFPCCVVIYHKPSMDLLLGEDTNYCLWSWK